LNECRCHNAKAKEVAYVGKIRVEIPTNILNVVENAKASNTTNKPERAVNSLKNKLCRSVFNHDFLRLVFLVF
jgi:transcriptional regulator of met regulon